MMSLDLMDDDTQPWDMSVSIVMTSTMKPAIMIMYTQCIIHVLYIIQSMVHVQCTCIDNGVTWIMCTIWTAVHVHV